MITRIEIEDNKRVYNHYIKDLETFKNGTVYEFKPGVNIIIGKNGCGKSTLLNKIAEYTLCPNTMSSEFPRELLNIYRMFDDNNKLYDGIRIYHDYTGKVFRYLPITELKKINGGEAILYNVENFSLAASNCSTGESMLEGLGVLFNKMFSEDTDLKFPIEEIDRYIKTSVNDVWKSKIKSLMEYYVKNRIKIEPKDLEYTVLMDEPDRNLDIDNLESIYDILNFHKPGVQIIAVIHNPTIIYKLSKIPEVNIIEMTEGYLNKVIKFLES